MTGLLGQSIWCRNHVSILPREAMRKLSEMFDVIPSRSKSVFIVCVHPTITIREHLLDRFTEVRKNIPGQNYNFYRLFTFISGTALYRSYFGGIFCCHGSNLRLVLGHSRATPQVVLSRGRDKNPA